MAKMKKDLIKLLTVAVAVCVSLFAYMFPKAQVKAEDSSTVAVFSVTKSASIRLPDGVDEIVDGEEKRYKGLRFSTQVNDLWFNENPANEYVFGTLIFPEDKGNLDKGISEYENASALSAVRIVADTEVVRADGGYTASVVFDHATVKKLAISSGLIDAGDPEINEKTDKLLSGLYSLRLTAVSYVKKDGEITYTNSYTTSITEVSVGLLSNPSWAEKVSEYVSLDSKIDDGYVLVSDGSVGNLIVSDVKEVFVDGKSVEYQIDGETLIIPSLIGDVVGNEYQITVLNNSSSAVIVKAVTADVAISSAEEFMAIFDAGDYNASNTYPIINSKYYVLACDINLENYLIDNTADANTIRLTGTFNGLGHTVFNATVDMTKYSGKATQGIFGTIEGTLTNVGFIDLKGTAKAGSDVGLTAPLSRVLTGKLENVYVGLSSTNYNVRGAIATYSHTAVLKDVVINVPQAEGYVFDDETYKTVSMSTSTYAYGYGSLGYYINDLNSNNLENVYVISPVPVNYAFGAGGNSFYNSNSLNTDYFYYGENETDVWFNYSYFASQGITNPTVENTKGAKGSSKTVVLDGIRRYDSIMDMANDVSAKNLENVKKFLELDGWKKGLDGELLWNGQKQTITVDRAVDYDANSGELITSVIDASKILKVTVGGEELTRGNGGLIYSNGVYSIRGKTSKDDLSPGVPYLSTLTDSSNVISMTVETEEDIYRFTNVNYYTVLISNFDEFKKALDIDYSITRFNYGFYAMDANLDLTGKTFDYKGFEAAYKTDNSVFNQNDELGFAGQFDGRGHSLSNVGNGAFGKGLFANFVYGYGTKPIITTTVENLAVLNWGCNSVSVFGAYTNNFESKFENIYVTYNSSAVVKGLINNPSNSKTIMNNIYVDNPGTTYVNNAAIYGEANGKGLFATKPFYAEGTLFGKLRLATEASDARVTNVISIGKSPLSYQTPDIADWSAKVTGVYSKFFTKKDNGDGTYTHKINTTGWDYDATFIIGEMYMGYAGNEKEGNVLNIKGLKPSFEAIAKYSNGSALAGYYCATCYDTYSDSTAGGNCSKCNVALTKSSNLWDVLGVYIFGVTDLTNYVNPASTRHNGEMVFHGASRFDTVALMASAYRNDASLYESFLGEDGNDMWGVNSRGQLIWKNNVAKDITVKVNGEQPSADVKLNYGDDVTVELYDGQNQVNIDEITSSNGGITVNGNVVTVNKLGYNELIVKYKINGVEFSKVVYVNVGHDYGELIKGDMPTCTVNGTISHYKCLCCDKYFDADFNEVLDLTIIASHDYSDWISGGDGTHYKVCKNDNTHVIVGKCEGGSASCTEGAICSVCNGVYTESLGHTGGVPTCEEWGKCTRCQESYVEPIGHDYTRKIITDEYLLSSANCLNKAVYYYACAHCGGTDESKIYEYGEPLGHTGGTADCKNLAICSRCGVAYGELADHVYVTRYDSEYHYEECTGCQLVINKYAHTLDAGVQTKDPTCVEFGVKTYSCACGYKEYEDVEMLAHELGAYVDEVPATCEQNGVKAHYQCSSCKQYFDEDGDLIKDVTLPKAHVFKKYNQPIEPLCDVTGRIGFYHCEVCGKFFEFDQVTELQESELEVPATGHADMSTGRCPCGENYASEEFFLEYFEFIHVGHKLPEAKDLNASGQSAYTWGYQLNRFYGDKPGAPVHIKIPATYKGQPVYKLANNLFDTTSSRASMCNPGTSGHENCTADNCNRLYYYKESEDGSNTSPTDGNPNSVAIQSIIIPEGIRMIGDSCFGNTEIRELVIPNSVVGGGPTKKQIIPEGAVYNKDIYDYPLYNICGGCNLLERVVIGSGVDVVGSYCFYGLSLLRDVEFVVEEVDNGDGTTRLEGVKEIRFRAFGSAQVAIDPTQPDLSTPKFVLPETLVSLPEGDIFDNNTAKLVRLYRLHSSDMIYYMNITREQYESMVIPAKLRDEAGNIVNPEDKYRTTYGFTEGWQGSSIIYFKGEWFYNDEGNPMAYEEVQEMEVPYDYTDGTYKILSSGAIVGLTDSGKKLETLNVPLTINGINITRIASNAFKFSKATNVVLSENITSVDAYAFRKMYNLTSVVATSKLKNIGKDLFRDSKNVRNLVILSKNSNVSDIVISGSNRIAMMSEKIGDFTLTVRGTNYIFRNSDNYYVLDNNGFVVSDKNVLVGYLGTEKEVTIYDDIVEIGDNVFENSSVNYVKLPNGLKKIGNNAFRNSDIVSIEIPQGVTHIGEGAFAYTNISEFTLPSNLTKISDNTFAGCKLLRKIYLNDAITEIGGGAFSNCSKLKEMILPSSVTKIGEGAFLGSESLSKVFIPKSVELIGAYAFSNCNGITSFEYEGTRADWNLVDVHRNWIFATNEFDIIFANGVGGSLDIQDSMTLLINQSGIIDHSLNGILFWSSNNEGVATVDSNGKVYAVDVGQAIITVKMGRDFGKCVVNVVYGDCLPSFVIENGIQDGDLLEKGKTYNLYSHINFNNKEFYDYSVTCSSSNTSVASVIYNQNSKAIVINALSTGRATVTVTASWREFTSNDAYTLTQEFTFDVIGSVNFFVNGDLPYNMSVLAPTDFTNESDSIATFVPTVVIDGNTYTPSVSIDYLGNANADYMVYDSENSRIVGYKVSKSRVMLRYTYNGIQMGTDIMMEVVPNAVTLSDTFLFSADDGLLMIENESGVYESVAVDSFLGETVNFAESEGGELFVDGDGSILGVSFNPVSYKYTTIDVVTDYARYTIPVQVAKRYIDTAEDFLEVLNVKENVADEGMTIEGSFALVNDLNMNRKYAYNFVNGRGSDSRGVDYFNGMFDGRGHTVSNLTIQMYKADCSNQGLFGTISENSVIKDIAFLNFLGKSTSDVGLTSPFAHDFYGKMENVYIEVASATCNNRGAINQIRSGAELNNVVITFKLGETFDYATVSQGGTWKTAWGYGSLAQGVSSTAVYNNVYVISSLPIYYNTGEGGAIRYDMQELDKDFFVYGENETEFWFNHTVNAGKTFDEVIVDLGSGVESKALRLNGVRRYDTLADIVSDTSVENVEKLNQLLSSGYWTTEGGTLAWA